ncbi:MAG TPA: TIGR03936 family radical SAM-associated protein [Dehalococcoidia bacterium]|nr:TIGR03936 family radical SAM-associated protein [Dehalococcoidia bacterium]
MKAQRLRIRYRITPAALGLGQRDTVDALVQAFTAAGLPIARSQGKRESALISLAAPLPQGVTSDGELADVFLSEVVRPAEALRRVAAAARPGIEIIGLEEIGVGSPSLQSQLRWAEYEARIPANALSEAGVQERIDSLLSSRSHAAEYKREKKTRTYDLRPLIQDITLEGVDEGGFRLRLMLRAEQENTARADETIAALGLPAPLAVHRRRLRVEEIPAVVQAFRAAGERER